MYLELPLLTAKNGTTLLNGNINKILAVLSRTSNSQVHLSDILFSLLMSHMCKPVNFTIVTLTAVVYGFFAHNTQASGQND